ncbi:protein-tyrosine phosphatase-like protein [Phialemonium atrogriseum]|uniref:Protein-tyrosine phosphatase-like protein n=1 Tax=Phialemonium atrogriseum TaxID=1093897 RepID=A0AAJ0C716_9PEZI|nr:protein-tyrosine phosphatase-like protein [Phialemonium atrogriseum]KAK1771166.1 protein-tyrosine phosphatase-like protein [Phialemonium atrogriseum]
MSAAHLRAIAEIDVTQPLPADQLKSTLVNPPFIYVPGTFNTRDLGLVPSSSGTSNFRKGYAYRSGALVGLAADGQALLAGKLGVKKIFDLRSVREHAQGPDPVIDGIQNVWRETTEKDAVVELADFIEGHGEKGYVKIYLDVLKIYQPSFKDVLEHVRDNPQEPFLFHCTAGRDRSGVLAGMLLALAGVDADTVSLDFMLSRVGTEPAREQLLAFARKGSGAETDDAPGFYNLCNLRTACWNAFLDAVDREYGGFDGYVTKTLGFTHQDLAIIKKNLAMPN